MPRFILDTDCFSLYQRRSEPLTSRLLRTSPADLAITIITVEEQLRGRLAQVSKAATPTKLAEAYYWLNETVELLKLMPTIGFDAECASIFERLRAERIRIGTQDLRIAAVALRHGGELVTGNTQDFERVPGLRLVDWTK